MANLKLTIDGQNVEAQAGDTVLQAARRAGIFIPSLCAHDELSPYGACRLCIVEIDGVRGTPTSCTTPVADGMVVRTNSELIEANRRRTLELMMSGHPSPCLTCDSSEECESVKKDPSRSSSATRCGTCSNRPSCELRVLAKGSFARDMNLRIFYSADKVEKNDPFIDRDHNLCVLCGRCFRVCEKVHSKPAIGISNRGKFAKISSEFDKAWSQEECLFCGACVDACPTGSLTDRWGKWFGSASFEKQSYCELCPKHCKIIFGVKDGRVVSARSASLKAEDSLCALGKFAYVQLLNSPKRLRRAVVREAFEQIPSSLETAAERLAEILKNSKANAEKVLVISNAGVLQQARKCFYEMAKFSDADFVEMQRNSSEKDLPEDICQKLSSGAYGVVVELGNYVGAEIAKNIPHFIVFDYVLTPVQEFAEILFPVSFMGEDAGEVSSLGGAELKLSQAVLPSEGVAKLSEISEKLCLLLGIEANYSFKSEVCENFESPSFDKTKIPNFDMGHFWADFAPDLELLGLSHSPEFYKMRDSAKGSEFEILENNVLAPNFHELKVKAPKIAKHAKPGQFAVLMAKHNSERSPFTLIDWNAEEGWVKFIIEEVGRSSAEIGALKKGDSLAVLSGPLGEALNLSSFKEGSKALLLGGCYGIAAIFPIARALKEMGVKVSCAIEASSAYMLYYKDKLSAVSDELIVGTRDGSEGIKGGCSDILKEIGENYDSIVAVGCVFMMKQCSSRVPEKMENAQCALNPIMVDGTGMCGACRVSVGSETKFACVEGPFFPLKEVDFDELAKRRSAYKLLEIEAMPRHIGGKCHA